MVTSTGEETGKEKNGEREMKESPIYGGVMIRSHACSHTHRPLLFIVLIPTAIPRRYFLLHKFTHTLMH